MQILILTKLKRRILKPTHKNIEDYIKDEHFFDGYNEGFKRLGHRTFLLWDESVLFPTWFKKKLPFIWRVMSFASRRTRISRLDRFLFSKKIATFCKNNDINVIFTEINYYISPRIIKKYNPQVLVTQWYGIFPPRANTDESNILSAYDIIWGAAEFDLSKVHFDGIEKLEYIGCAVNDKSFYHDYDEKYAHDVVFYGGVGGAHSDRIGILEKVAQEFEDFVFYGVGIDHVPANYKLRSRFMGWVDTDTIRKLISSSKIVINLTLDGYDRLKRGFNARLFEISACGGAMQITISDKKLDEFFEVEKEIEIFSSTDELVEKIRYYLEHNCERRSIVQASQNRTNRYTYYERAKKMIEIIEKSDIIK